MIGSLLFYGLYPLSRYLFRRPLDVSKKSLPPAVVNGTAVWDGGPAATRKFTQSQTALLDQWLSPSSGSKGETKERMKGQSPIKKDLKRPDTDKEQLMTVVHLETKNEAASKMTEVQSATNKQEMEMQDGKEQDKVESPKQEGKEIQRDVFYMKQNSEDGTAFATEDQRQEQELGTQLECLHTEDSLLVATCPLWGKMKILSIDESVSSHQESGKTTTYPVEEQIEIQSLEESVSPAEPSRLETECWDEYLTPNVAEQHEGVNSSVLDFSSLLSNEQIPLKFNEKHDTQTGWHFPTGPGLADEVKCPLWHYPAVSYYPSLEPTGPFEVMWRVWEERDESASAAEPTPMSLPFTKASMDFTVMSYNILAPDLLQANEQLYIHCPLEVLDWSYRCSLLLEEIQKWSPDIMCLQEVQENHYQEQLLPVLSEMGYTCVYKRRTGDKTDGCATCYRSCSFSEVSVTMLEFFRPETEVLDRHNVGIVLLLRPVVTKGSKVKAKGPLLCVANTHLLFNPRRGDVKLAQLAIVLAEINSVVKSCKAKGEPCNVILSGDFNSIPHTPLYRLITTGELYFHGLPAWMISGQEDLPHKAYCHRLFAPLWPSCLGITDTCQYTSDKEVQSPVSGKRQYSHDFLLQLRFCPVACVRPHDLQLIHNVTDNTPDASRGNLTNIKSFRNILSHRLDLESVYTHVLPGSGSPEVTTLHSEAGATVDYIFYSPKRTITSDQKAGGGSVSEGLKLIGCLSLLSEDVLWSMKGLPNHRFPSDHLSLLAKFRMDLNAA